MGWVEKRKGKSGWHPSAESLSECGEKLAFKSIETSEVPYHLSKLTVSFLGLEISLVKPAGCRYPESTGSEPGQNKIGSFTITMPSDLLSPLCDSDCVCQP
jgi:hypothetical protein